MVMVAEVSSCGLYVRGQNGTKHAENGNKRHLLLEGELLNLIYLMQMHAVAKYPVTGSLYTHTSEQISSLLRQIGKC